MPTSKIRCKVAEATPIVEFKAMSMPTSTGGLYMSETCAPEQEPFKRSKRSRAKSSKRHSWKTDGEGGEEIDSLELIKRSISGNTAQGSPLKRSLVPPISKPLALGNLSDASGSLPEAGERRRSGDRSCDRSIDRSTPSERSQEDFSDEAGSGGSSLAGSSAALKFPLVWESERIPIGRTTSSPLSPEIEEFELSSLYRLQSASSPRVKTVSSRVSLIINCLVTDDFTVAKALLKTCRDSSEGKSQTMEVVKFSMSWLMLSKLTFSSPTSFATSAASAHHG